MRCCGVLLMVKAIEFDHTGNVGCDVAHGGSSSGREVGSPIFIDVVSK